MSIVPLNVAVRDNFELGTVANSSTAAAANASATASLQISRYKVLRCLSGTSARAGPRYGRRRRSRQLEDCSTSGASSTSTQHERLLLYGFKHILTKIVSSCLFPASPYPVSPNQASAILHLCRVSAKGQSGQSLITNSDNHAVPSTHFFVHSFAFD